MTKSIPAALLLAVTAISASHAASSGLEFVTPDQTRTLQVELPQSRVAPAKPLADLPDAQRTHLELGVSSWMPHDFSYASFAGQSTAFHSDSIPGFSLSLLSSPLLQNSWVGLCVLGSLSAYTMIREGQTSTLGSTITSQQRLFIVPLELGTQLALTRLDAQHLIPYLGASVLPTIFSFGNSSMADPNTVAGLQYQTKAGVRWSLVRTLGVAYGLQLDASIFRSFGGISGVDVGATGFQAALAFPI